MSKTFLQTSFLSAIKRLGVWMLLFGFFLPTLISHAQIITRFGSSGYYTGDYWMGTLPHSAAFRFFSNGTYTFYRDGNAQGGGTYSIYSYPGNFQLSFQVSGYQNGYAHMDERSASFYLENGPADWPTIQYTYDGH